MLRARCQTQREQFMTQLAGIEQRLQHADATLASVRNFFARPGVVAAGLALLVGLKRFKAWSLLSRGWIVFTAARRMYRMFRR